jgi:hypothetical protein
VTTTFGGGNGASFETAVLVNAAADGMRYELGYIGDRHGREDKDWSVDDCTFTDRVGRLYDIVEISLRSGEKKTYYFDITQFYITDESGTIESVCPHCDLQGTLDRKRWLGAEVFECRSCHKLGRILGVRHQVFGILLLIPVAIGLAVATLAGIKFLIAMPESSLGNIAIALVLLPVAGYAEYRAILAIRRFVKPRVLRAFDRLTARSGASI